MSEAEYVLVSESVDEMPAAIDDALPPVLVQSNALCVTLEGVCRIRIRSRW